MTNKETRLIYFSGPGEGPEKGPSRTPEASRERERTPQEVKQQLDNKITDLDNKVEALKTAMESLRNSDTPEKAKFLDKVGEDFVKKAEGYVSKYKAVLEKVVNGTATEKEIEASLNSLANLGEALDKRIAYLKKHTPLTEEQKEKRAEGAKLARAVLNNQEKPELTTKKEKKTTKTTTYTSIDSGNGSAKKMKSVERDIREQKKLNSEIKRIKPELEKIVKDSRRYSGDFAEKAQEALNNIRTIEKNVSKEKGDYARDIIKLRDMQNLLDKEKIYKKT